MTDNEILDWLRESDSTRLATLWREADAVRRERVGDAVHLRGLVEISNYCVRQCRYCGLRSGNKALERYRMNADEILSCAHEAVRLGYGTIVMQSGEDYGIKTKWMAEIIREIKIHTRLAVTLSLGERPDRDLAAWRDAGADRYLLRFETSNPALYRRIHPSLPNRASDRLAILARLRGLGYEVGSGVMVGIPGQTYRDLAHDIALFRQLDLDMVGIGPYIPHPATPLGAGGRIRRIDLADQVSNTEGMACTVVALTRLVCPEANIPSTTALATINSESGHEHGLQRGANVLMPNITPTAYRSKYEIYPGKGSIEEISAASGSSFRHRLTAIGRRVARGAGSRTHRTGAVSRIA